MEQGYYGHRGKRQAFLKVARTLIGTHLGHWEQHGQCRCLQGFDHAACRGVPGGVVQQDQARYRMACHLMTGVGEEASSMCAISLLAR